MANQPRTLHDGPAVSLDNLPAEMIANIANIACPKDETLRRYNYGKKQMVVSRIDDEEELVPSDDKDARRAFLSNLLGRMSADNRWLLCSVTTTVAKDFLTYHRLVGHPPSTEGVQWDMLHKDSSNNLYAMGEFLEPDGSLAVELLPIGSMITPLAATMRCCCKAFASALADPACRSCDLNCRLRVGTNIHTSLNSCVETCVWLAS